VNVVDLRPALLEARRRERVYHKTDTHWNARGAHAAYEAILNSLGVHGLRPAPRSAFRETASTVPGLDLARMLGLGHRLNEVDLGLEPKMAREARMVEPRNAVPHGVYARLVTEREGTGLPRAVIFRDSFTTALIPFLSEHFSRALYLWEYDVNPEVIAAERPQVVIQQIVGRHLGQVLPYNYIAAMGRLKPAPTDGRPAATDSAGEGPAPSGAGAATRTPLPAPTD
jgi:hypothetical protein